MSLQDFQTHLGLRLLGRDTAPDPLFGTAGFALTAKVQRSWSRFRAEGAARPTLDLLPATQSASLLDRWLDMGGGAKSFASSEAEAFLEFIAAELPEPSDAMTICRTQQAIVRATAAALDFMPPPVDRPIEGAALVGRHPDATLVPFPSGPGPLLALLDAKATVTADSAAVDVLFAPGLAGLCRIAEAEEVSIWRELVEPRVVAEVFEVENYRRILMTMLSYGALELRHDCQ
jgi:hypothetical protein